MSSLDFKSTKFTTTRQNDGRQEVDIVAGAITAADVSTGTPVSTGLANATGAATSLARSNHVHAIGAVPTARVIKGGAQSIPNIAYTAVTFDGETFDTDTLHDNVTNPERLTAVRAGTYKIFGTVGFAASAAGTQRNVRVYKNGVASNFTSVGGMNATIQPYIPVEDLLSLAAGDYVELRAYQDSGAALDALAASIFAMIRIGD